MTFQELNISRNILQALAEKGYANPTPIQEKAIPVALRGKDLLGTARTGTGKTAAFAIPIIQQLDNERATGRPRQIKALVLTPTRELAAQVGDCFREYAAHTRVRHAVIFGGVKQKAQTDALARGVDVLVATPGRLNDLMNQGFIRLDNVRHFVLDEADRMLDMGFIADIKRLLPRLPRERQTLFFSATMPPPIADLARAMLRDPVKVAADPADSVVETVEQRLYLVEKQQKKDLLISLLQKEREKSVLVFSRTKHGADKIARVLSRAGIGSEALHGDKSQNARERALANFKSGKTRVMIATDIAARGIDVIDLPLVINYDLPDVPETYVHRVGRTGRAGRAGLALTFCSSEETAMMRDIQKLTGKQLSPATL
ncbi:MAG: DEAD/DEAH box helicase [Odoribacteraceae bacterium]|jgi:ATP-dependent RNA helicase RhlE|nr:DEAD/DEAH box helicase [Odoribacteraceae bacterium]